MIRKATKNDYDSCLKIAKGLPEWFSENGLKEISQDLRNLDTYVYDNGQVLGYVCIEERQDNTIEIKQLAVRRSSQRHGIGRALLNYVENEAALGRTIEVKTLDVSCEYKPYEQTRAFYEKNGFTKIAVIDPCPGWDKGNPCAVYAKKAVAKL